ncbi:hypothetical protein GQ57_32345 [Burkholderia sp. MSh2]|uniref:Uncharacterized protein n=1 Tax=Burkholderia paludis TaxID=1506587 RepID=A0A6P2SEL5_9BURK|nr:MULTISPECIES: hypothetical protein [Burkholderia]KEZ01912.1 hypothetical protein GQ57_32345 [Burkholderia sp. MSh2]KFG93419.1 hypothetical protein GQ56_0131655 [Burkholderia paludis]CAB3772057.1 hypothetical protein LMG30113_06596 [Burkholderia paludis]VWC41681.1 hypothetical protein BPA30113_06967 [Burkholderia paludis]
MDSTMSNRAYFKYWRLCAACGPIFLTAFIVCWGILGHNIPPIPADRTPEQMADFFRTHYGEVRAGMAGAMLFGVLYLPWTLSITKVMERINPKENDILPVLQMWGGGITVVPLVTSSVFWLTGAYRPDVLSPVTLQMLYDMGWLLIDMFYAITTIPMVAIGVAGLTDPRAKPLFPRWACWYSIWAGLSFLFELMMPVFKTGPFARQGWLNFWIEFLVWFGYIVVVTLYVFKAIPRLERERVNQSAPAGKAAVAPVAAGLSNA